jgi:uncharacterized protein DUF2024
MDTVQVFDTWVEVPGKRLHFDVMTSDSSLALKLANEYVATLGHRAITVTSEECRFCHHEPLVMFNEDQQRAFQEAGGFIVPLSA